ncbi:MAG TPA: HK97 family phage prohead protease [Elusimicrobiales bacterium]|nr:HK97 family phage prohead protease [Elusimicrobiales bacterium]
MQLGKVGFAFPLQILKYSEEAGEFHIVGYAATTDFDLQGDVITEDALKESSLDLLKNSTVLLNHDVKLPIGKVTKAEFDKHGLLIDALISKTEPDIIQKIKEGVLNKFSIRGQVLERERKFMPEYDRVVNVIQRMSLVEVSLVSVPANPEAKAIGWYIAKALDENEENQGGTNMPDEVIIEELPSQGGTPAPQEPEQPKPEAAPAKADGAAPVEKPKPADQVAQTQERKPAEIQKTGGEPVAAKAISMADLAKLIAGEVAKQLETALKTVPAVRKGIIQPDSEADELRKQFDSLPPEKKLRAVLAVRENK